MPINDNAIKFHLLYRTKIRWTTLLSGKVFVGHNFRHQVKYLSDNVLSDKDSSFFLTLIKIFAKLKNGCLRTCAVKSISSITHFTLTNV